MLKYKGRTDLTAREARHIFQDALQRELVRAIDPYLERDADKDGLVLTSKFWAGVYGEAQRSVEELRKLQQDIYVAPAGVELSISRDAGTAWLLAEMKRNEVEEECPSALERAGVPVNPGTLAQALVQRLRGRAAAHERAQLAADPRISSREDLLGALLDEALVAAVRDGVPLVTAAPMWASASPAGCIYLEQDPRRFADIIDDVCAAIQAKNDWNDDLDQRKRIMKAFAWITGNKRLCDYRPSDITNYKAALVRFPKDFE